MINRRSILAIFMAGCLMVTVAAPLNADAQDTLISQEQEQLSEAVETSESMDEILQVQSETADSTAEQDENGSDSPADDDIDITDSNTEKEIEDNTDGSVKKDTQEIVLDPEDPGNYRLEGKGSGDFKSSKISVRAVSLPAKYQDCEIETGIDVSYHNGTIDWKKVKNAGVDFAIIRVAYRGYSTGKLAMDNKALENLKNATAAGIPVGVYIFSQAVSPAEAVQEADYIISKIQGYKITLPVVFDFEYVATGVGRLYNANLSKSQGTDVCKAFCDRVNTLGYTPMVYASKSMYESKTYAADFSQQYPVWMAHYTTAPSYTGEYEYWQYSEKGSIDGINDRNVDLNYRYVNRLRITGKTASSISMKWEKKAGIESYDIYRRNESGQYVPVKTGIRGNSYTDSGLTSGKEYSYKIYPQGGYGKDKCVGFNTGITALQTGSISGKALGLDKIRLTWGKDPKATAYTIQRYDSAGKKYRTIKTATASEKSFTDSKKAPATKYMYRICSYGVVFNGRVYGDYSRVTTVKTKSKVGGMTKGKGINLRKKATKSSKKLGTLKKKGTKVTVTGIVGDWYRVSVKINGKTKNGYIKKNNIKLL